MAARGFFIQKTSFLVKSNPRAAKVGQFCVSLSQPFENNLRAVKAYDEALKVRNPRDTPIEYAKTIANKANALINLPDKLPRPEAGNPQNLLKARTYYQEALEIFTQQGQIEQAQAVSQVLEELVIEQ